MSSRRRRRSRKQRIKQKSKWKKDERKIRWKKTTKKIKNRQNYMWNVTVRKNAFLEWKRIEKTKKSFPKKKLCFVRFLLVRKFCEGEQWNTRFLLHFCQKKMAYRNLFCCWKNQQKWEHKEETSREHKQRDTQKEEIAFTTSFRKRYVLEKMLQKKRK